MRSSPRRGYSVATIGSFNPASFQRSGTEVQWAITLPREWPPSIFAAHFKATSKDEFCGATPFANVRSRLSPTANSL
jgi:hypothetical protein